MPYLLAPVRQSRTDLQSRLPGAAIVLSHPVSALSGICFGPIMAILTDRHHAQSDEG